MAMAAGRLMAPGPKPGEVWITLGLSVLLHGLLVGSVVLLSRVQFGHYITVPVSYTVNLVDAPPGGRGGGGPSPAPSLPAPAAPPTHPAPVVRPAPRPSEELRLPGRRPIRKAEPQREPSLLPPQVTGRESARPTPSVPAPVTPARPAGPPVAPPAPSVASVGAGTGAGKGSGVELAGPAGGAGGGTALATYLTLVDWKIQSNWNPLTASETPAVIRFRVLRSGEVREVELEASSGNGTLDAAALRAMRQSVPLPPFSNLLTEPFLDLRYRFFAERG